MSILTLHSDHHGFPVIIELGEKLFKHKKYQKANIGGCLMYLDNVFQGKRCFPEFTQLIASILALRFPGGHHSWDSDLRISMGTPSMLCAAILDFPRVTRILRYVYSLPPEEEGPSRLLTQGDRSEEYYVFYSHKPQPLVSLNPRIYTHGEELVCPSAPSWGTLSDHP